MIVSVEENVNGSKGLCPDDHEGKQIRWLWCALTHASASYRGSIVCRGKTSACPALWVSPFVSVAAGFLRTSNCRFWLVRGVMVRRQIDAQADISVWKIAQICVRWPTNTEWAVLLGSLSAGSWVERLLILSVGRIAVKAEVMHACRCHRRLSCCRWTLH